MKKERSNFGKLTILEGFLLLIPTIVTLFYIEEIKYAKFFIIPSLATMFIGFIMLLIPIKNNHNADWKSSYQYSYITVLYAWILGIIIGSIPFWLSGQLSYIHSLFESISGWTTTGLSVIDVTKTPKIFLFFRSFMQFIGGLGFVFMMTAMIQTKQSMPLFSAEGHIDKLEPNLKKTAGSVIFFFLSALLIGTIAFKIVGMNFFDGINHTMCALSTGGFSVKLNSIGEYNSIGIYSITIILMFVGTTNFAVLQLLVKGNIKQLLKVSELRFMFVLLLIMIPLIAISLITLGNYDTNSAFLSAIFDGTSALSTTGFSSTSYYSWPPVSIGLMIILMLIGGGLGSTAGGMKLNRVYIALRMLGANVSKKFFASTKVFSPYYEKAQGKARIDDRTSSDCVYFIMSYLFLFVLGSLLISAFENCSLTESFFEFASALGTVGLSIGITGQHTTNPTLIVEMIGMILGRLEIFTVLIAIQSLITRPARMIKIRKNITKHEMYIKNIG